MNEIDSFLRALERATDKSVLSFGIPILSLYLLIKLVDLYEWCKQKIDNYKKKRRPSTNSSSNLNNTALRRSKVSVARSNPSDGTSKKSFLQEALIKIKRSAYSKGSSHKEICKKIGDIYFLMEKYDKAYDAYEAYARYQLSPLGNVLEGFYQRARYTGSFSPYEDYIFFSYVMDAIFYMGISLSMKHNQSAKNRFPSDFNSVVKAIKYNNFNQEFVANLYKTTTPPSLYSICYDEALKNYQWLCDDKIKFDRYGRYPSDGRTFDERTEFDYANLIESI